MSLPAENPNKVSNIVKHQLPNFRRLYAPLIQTLPNVTFKDPRCNSPDWIDDAETNAILSQDMDPIKRGNMVRRLPNSFREKLYFRYQSKFQIPQLEFNRMLDSTNDEDPTRVRRKQGGPFEQRIASEDHQSLNQEVKSVIRKTIRWPSLSQSLKGPVTAGFSNTTRYLMEKLEKYREGQRASSTSGVEKIH